LSKQTVASAAILSRTVTILEVAHNVSGSIVLADARTFHEFWEGDPETIEAASGAMRLK
jgi:hypothetical protein